MSVFVDSAWVNLVAFSVAVMLMLLIDLGLFRSNNGSLSLRQAAAWSAWWIAVSCVFGIGVWLRLGPEAGVEFFTAYLLEKTLSIDNVFVFVMVFGAFSIPAARQPRILFWGVLGAVVLRVVFIMLGAALLNRAHFVLNLFGVFLMVSAVKLAMSQPAPPSPSEHKLGFPWLTRLFRVSPLREGAFFVRDSEHRVAVTPLFLALLAVAFTDVVFAVDSIPAVFAVSRDPFIVLTSNVFAVLGLRSLFFLLAGSISRFVYLRYGLAVVLAFVGLKMFASQMVAIPSSVSLVFIAAVLGVTVALSLWRTHRHPPRTPSCESRP